ncbi:MAG: hypothetical protein ACTHZD_04645 [Micrococcaceae bacterium]
MPPTDHLETPATASTTGQRIASAVLALIVGAGSGLIGTLLHLQLHWFGSVMIPWGALLALVLTGCAQLWATLATRQLWVGALTVVAAYTVIIGIAFLPTRDVFNIAINSYTWQALPGPVIAEGIWLFGVPVVAIIVLLLSARLLPRTVPQRPAPAATH